ncbi:MAG TPA: cytidine deaminase [Aeromicrobium sp.]|nr:cytidine deaminase [Aeromicrobium sp.]
MTELDAQDAKLVTLARASMARIGADQGAAVRDADGRSYAAGPVALPSLAIGALDLAVAQAVSAGATRLEAAAIVTRAGEDAEAGLAAVREVGGEGLPVYVANPQGDVIKVLTT